MTAFISCEPTAGRHCHHCGISGTHRWRRLQHSRYLIHDKFQQEGTLPWQCISWAWAMSGLSCGSWTLLHWGLSEASIYRDHRATKAMEEKQLDTEGCQDWEDWRLWVFVTAQRLLLYLWICNCRAGSERSGTGVEQHPDVLRASWNYTSCLQKQERQAAVMGSRVTSSMVGRHLPMHMAR